jgi:hypothetical protein
MSAQEEFCCEKGILLEVTAPYTLEENSITEWANRVIITKAQCIMRGRPSFLWSEALKAL